MRSTFRIVARNVVVICLVGVLAPTSPADTVVQQVPVLAGGAFSDLDCNPSQCPTGQRSYAEDFTLDQDLWVTAVVIWGAYFPTNLPVADDFTLRIHGSNLGVPGGSLFYDGTVTTTRTMTGQRIDVFDEYRFELALDAPRFLSAGTYFVEIYNNTNNPSDFPTFYWELGWPDPDHGADGVAVDLLHAPGTSWARQSGVNLAFEVEAMAGCSCGDIDGSGGAIDLNDFAAFANCFGLVGPGPNCDAVEFACSDMDASGAVDLDDFSTFSLIWATTPTSVVPNCVVILD